MNVFEVKLFFDVSQRPTVKQILDDVQMTILAGRYDAMTKIPNVDWFNEYLNKLNEFNLYGYNTQNSHLCSDKIERCYVKTRLIWDDGG